MLLEEGVPSVLRRARGFDVPDFLAAGPRDVMVPASGAETAGEVLLEAEIVPAATPGAGTGAGGSPARLLAAGIARSAASRSTRVPPSSRASRGPGGNAGRPPSRRRRATAGRARVLCPLRTDAVPSASHAQRRTARAVPGVSGGGSDGFSAPTARRA